MTPQQAMEQAALTAAFYIGEGIETIDGCFGEGYAKHHPELLAAFMKVAAQDFSTWVISERMSERVDHDHS